MYPLWDEEYRQTAPSGQIEDVPPLHLIAVVVAVPVDVADVPLEEKTLPSAQYPVFVPQCFVQTCPAPQPFRHASEESAQI
jgi:hypothetical protein